MPYPPNTRGICDACERRVVVEEKGRKIILTVPRKKDDPQPFVSLPEVREWVINHACNEASRKVGMGGAIAMKWFSYEDPATPKTCKQCPTKVESKLGLFKVSRLPVAIRRIIAENRCAEVAESA